jgi:asparagine synthase (glutamine-hydrolysing)
LRRGLGALAGRAPARVKGRNYLRHVALDGAERYLDAATFFRREQQRELFSPAVFDLVSAADPRREALGHLTRPDRHWLSSVQHLDMKQYLPLDILTKVDRMSMAHSIEARVPLLDHKLIEFAATIPPELKLRQGNGKHIFRRALRGVVPVPVLQRPKQGFAVPLGRWFQGRLASFVRELLLSRAARQRGLINPAYVENLLDRKEGGSDLDFQLWTLISFELWARRFLDQAWQASPAPAPVLERQPLVTGPAARAAVRA